MDEKELDIEKDVVEPEVVEAEVVSRGELLNIEGLQNKRADFLKKYNRSRILGYLSTGIVVAVVVIAYMVVLKHSKWAAILMIIVALVGSVFLTRLNRNSMTKTIGVYMENYYHELYDIVMEGEPISEVRFELKKRIETDEFVNARILKNVEQTNSRNMLEYNLGNKEVAIADYYAYRYEKKREETVFLGKFLVSSSPRTFKERILIYIKPNPEIHKEYTGPDDNSELVTFVDDQELYVMSESEAYKKIITARHLELLRKLKTNRLLSDVALSLYENKVAVTLTYSNDILIVPSRNEVSYAAIRQYKDDIKLIHEFLNLL